MTEKRFKLDDFDSEVEMLELINTQSETISDLEKENEQIIIKKERYKTLCMIAHEQIDNRILTIKNFVEECSDDKVKKALKKLLWTEVQEHDVSAKNRALINENKELKTKVDFYKDFQTDARELDKENEQLKQDNDKLIQLLENQSIIIHELHSKLMRYQLEEPIVLTKEDLEIMGKAISYYTHEGE